MSCASAVVTAFTDLSRLEPGATRRGTGEYLELARPLLALPIPMVVFCDRHLADAVAEMRPPGERTFLEEFPESGDPEWLAGNLALVGRGPRPACLANERKDTAAFIRANHLKAGFLRRAAALVDAPMLWWIDFGIAHVSPVPRDLAGRLRTFPARDGDDRPWLMSLERWSPFAGNDVWSRNHDGARRSDDGWWHAGAPIVAGGVFGVPARSVDAFAAAWGNEVERAGRAGTVTSDEMVLSRIAFDDAHDAVVVPSAYYSLLDDLVSAWHPRLADMCPSVRWVSLPAVDPGSWSSFNPSVARHPEGGFLLVLRQANYRYDDGRYVTVDSDGVIRTRNLLVRLGEDLEVLSVDVIDDSRVRPEIPRFPVHGLEDARLFLRDGHWWVSATIREHRGDGLCEVLVARLEGTSLVDGFIVGSPFPGRHEKNWIPVPGRPRMTWMWSIDPPVLVSVDDATGGQILSATISERHPSARGGSQVAEFEDGWLAVVHEVRESHARGRPRKVYVHRFARLDAEMRNVEFSAAFVMLEEGIEFCAGLAVEPDRVVLSFGRSDKDAWLAVLSVDDVRSLFTDRVVAGFSDGR